jgi:two-component system chemotaxis response regulator CheB
MDQTRVLIVDDSVATRALLRGFLEADAGIVVVGEAHNGRDAIALAARLKPDLVTIALDMPVLGGMEAIAEIMSATPVPILVVASEAHARHACEAVAHGALDMLITPRRDSAALFVAKVKLLAKVPVIRHIRSQAGVARDVPAGAAQPAARPRRAQPRPAVCAIVASTGGPQALATILGMLPRAFPCPILVAQHIADGFAPGMVEWLGTICALPVRLACDGERVKPGTVYLSPSEANLAVCVGGWLQLVARHPGQIYHPTGDVLLASVAGVYGSAGIGVILTGMGSDGALGLDQLRQAGGTTMAQDEASSVIFGMNRVAIETGAATHVLALADIARALCRFTGLAE